MQIRKHYMRLENAHLTQSVRFTQPTKKAIHLTVKSASADFERLAGKIFY